VAHLEGFIPAGFKTQKRGFSLLELMVAMGILLSVSGIVMSAIVQMSLVQGTIGNRTEMHSGLRSATETIQQEIGQAGRIPALPAPVTLSAAVAPAAGALVTATVNSVAGMFTGELLQVDAGGMGINASNNCPVTYQNPETVAISNINTTANTFQANFVNAHCANAPVVVAGAFPGGIIPTDDPNSPSTGSILRMFGDINGDGTIVYVEYNCDTTNGNLTRSVTPYDQLLKNTATTILPNISANPPASNPTPCFQYQQKPNGIGGSAVVDVTFTLTVNTQVVDPQTHVLQTETKALLNVSPRNVFGAWQLGGGTVLSRLQPIPASVTVLALQ
jgi:prepilin-type N-terminal cleavage/methylation domain-containing protein